MTALRNSCLSVLRSEANLEFDALDKLGQCCLILGGILFHGSLPLAADKACENFVGGSWNIRCKALTELGIASPMTSSFTSLSHSSPQLLGEWRRMAFLLCRTKDLTHTLSLSLSLSLFLYLSFSLSLSVTSNPGSNLGQ